MAWGGGGGGGFFGGGPAHGQGPGQAPGVGFSGIPSEMAKMVEQLTDREPEPEPVDIEFSHVAPAGEPPLSLRRMLATRKLALGLVVALVSVETVTQQIGPRLTQVAIDRGVIPRDFGFVLLVAVAYVASVGVAMLSGSVRVRFAGRLGEGILYQLRLRVFSHLQRLSLAYFTEEKAGRIMTRMTSDIEALQVLFQEGLASFFLQLLTLVFVLSQLFWMNAQLALIMTVIMVPALMAMTLWFRAASDRGYLTVRDRIADVLADLQENLAGIRVVAAHNRQRRNTIRHRNIAGDHLKANTYTARIAALYGPGTEALGVVVQGALLLIGGRMVLNGSLTLGELTAFVLFVNAFFMPIQQLVQLYNAYQQGRAAIIKLRELLALQPTVAEKLDAVALPPIEGAVALEGVTFGYRDDQPVLRDVDLAIRAGETFALVGPTGAGKSTIAKLVARFYDPQAGRVLVDGHDLRDVTFESLRRQLGIVPQEPFLFEGTVRDNVSFARSDVDEADVLDACRAVGIGELIDRLPEGLATPVYERGVTFSSGERQLLALARAFLAQPRVLILDEATSSLDLSTEAAIERALDTLLDGRTAILIAHRLNTAMRADRIAVVDGGGIAEIGSHDELLAAGGAYAELHRAWQDHGGLALARRAEGVVP